MIYITAGHSAKHGKNHDPGAIANGYKEADLAVELRELIEVNLNAAGASFKTDQDDWNLNETIVNASTTEKDVVFDLHFNAATPAATGCEIFIPTRHTSEEYDTAKEVVGDLAKLLEIPLRGKHGVKTEDQCRHKRLGMMRPSGMNFLIEICFITNKSDMDSYQKHKSEIAAMIATKLLKAEGKFR